MTDWLNPNSEPSTGDGDGEGNASRRSLRPIEGTVGQDWLSQPVSDAVRHDYAAVDDSAQGTKKTPLFDRLSSRAQKGLLFGGLVTFVTLLAGAAGLALMEVPSGDSGNENSAADKPSLQATADQQTSSDTTSQTVYAGKCDGAGLGVEPSTDTLKGSVAAFQKAYFSKDADALTRVLADDSPLKQQDWKRILGDVNRESTYCVKITPVSASTVDTDLTVKTDGSKKTYLQKVTGVNKDGKWLISEFEKRSGSGS